MYGNNVQYARCVNARGNEDFIRACKKEGMVLSWKRTAILNKSLQLFSTESMSYSMDESNIEVTPRPTESKSGECYEKFASFV